MVYRVACDIDCFTCDLGIPEIKERGGTCAEDKTKLCRIFGTGSKKNNRSKKGWYIQPRRIRKETEYESTVFINKTPKREVHYEGAPEAFSDIRF